MSVELLKECHNWFYNERGFVWQSDKERLGKYERWQILKNETGTFFGDCEDAALTIMNRMIEKGVPIESVYIVRVASIECKGLFDHAILGYRENETWYFSDNAHQNYPACDKRSLYDYRFYDSVSVRNLRGHGMPEMFP